MITANFQMPFEPPDYCKVVKQSKYVMVQEGSGFGTRNRLEGLIRTWRTGVLVHGFLEML